VQADFCFDLKKTAQGICKFAQVGQKMGVKSGLFQSFSRLFHRKIGKIPVFLWFFVIFERVRLRGFKKGFVFRKVMRGDFLRDKIKSSNLHQFSKKMRANEKTCGNFFQKSNEG